MRLARQLPMTRLTRNGDPRAAQTLKAQLRLRQMILDGELSAGERVPELMLVERIVALPFASPSAFVMAQSELADAHQILTLSQEQHRAILEALAAGASA